MLEKIDLSKKVDKKTYRRVMDEAEEKLGLLQRECKDAGIPVILVFEGMGAAGKGVQINRLIQALDPRGFDVYACILTLPLQKPQLLFRLVHDPAVSLLVNFFT